VNFDIGDGAGPACLFKRGGGRLAAGPWRPCLCAHQARSVDASMGARMAGCARLAQVTQGVATLGA